MLCDVSRMDAQNCIYCRHSYDVLYCIYYRRSSDVLYCIYYRHSYEVLYCIIAGAPMMYCIVFIAGAPMMMMAAQSNKGYQGDDANANDQFYNMYQSKFIYCVCIRQIKLAL